MASVNAAMTAAKSLALLLAGLPWIALAAAECRLKPSPAVPSGSEVMLQVQCEGLLVQEAVWSFGDGTSATTVYQPSAKHVYARPGLYSVHVRITSANGDTSAVEGSQTVLGALPPGNPGHATTILFDSARSRVWAVNPDNHTVVYLDWPSRRRSPEIRVGRHPRSLALASDGTIWVCNQDDASLTLLDGESGARLGTVALPRGSHPFGIVIDKGNGLAYVTAQGLGTLLKVSLGEKRVVGSLPVSPVPRGLAVTHDGKRIFVTRFLSSRDEGEVVEVDGPSFRVIRKFPLAYDDASDSDRGGAGTPNAVNAVVLRPDEQEAWVTAKKDNTRRGRTVSGRDLDVENTVRTVYCVLDLARNEENPALREDLNDRSMAKAIAFSSQGAYAFIATEGSNTVEVYHAIGHLRISSIGPPAVQGSSELAPQGLVVHPNDSLIFVQYFTSREIGVYDITQVGGSNLYPRVALIKTVDTDSLSEAEARGLRIFYDAGNMQMGKNGYIACASCHMEGGSDERVWDFTQRGEGLRNTTTLQGKGGLAQGPLHWSANFDEIQDFEHDIRDGQGGTGFLADDHFRVGTRNTPLGDRKTGLSADLDALAAYITSLSRVPASPFRTQGGGFSAAAEEGRKIFARAEVGCAKCHSGPSYTDSRLPVGSKPAEGPVSIFAGARSSYTAQGFLVHDVGTLKNTPADSASGKRLGEPLKGLDTPTLKGVWATAPYLHDGSAATLLDVIQTFNPEDKHGKTSHLSRSEKESLVQFLLELDDGDGVSTALQASARRPHADRLTGILVPGGMEFRFSGPERPELRVFSAQGKLLERFGPGAPWLSRPYGWSLPWRAVDGTGKGLPSGLYLAIAKSGGQIARLRMALP